uniref:C-type lectin domain-containing protein n=1 Tax=Maylandia zebra TaxID=106582 RepID=A0A3P9CLM8_9CICH
MKRCGLILLLLSGLLNKTFDVRKSKKAQSELLHRDYFKGVCKRASSSHRNTRTISKDLCHSDQLVRQLHLVDLQKSWNDAQQYCRDEYIDLAIVNSSALIQEAQKRAGSTEAWIGLSKGWTWSQTGPVQSSWFNMWSPGQPGTDECVIITGSGSWSTAPCSNKHYFVCYDGECFRLWYQGLTN